MEGGGKEINRKFPSRSLSSLRVNLLSPPPPHLRFGGGEGPRSVTSILRPSSSPLFVLRGNRGPTPYPLLSEGNGVTEERSDRRVRRGKGVGEGIGHLTHRFLLLISYPIPSHLRPSTHSLLSFVPSRRWLEGTGGRNEGYGGMKDRSLGDRCVNDMNTAPEKIITERSFIKGLHGETEW